MSRMQVGRGARLIQVIGPAVPVREEGGKPAGHIYQLNGVERGQARAQLGARIYAPSETKLCAGIQALTPSVVLIAPETRY